MLLLLLLDTVHASPIPLDVRNVVVNGESWDDITLNTWRNGVRDADGRPWPAMTTMSPGFSCIDGRPSFSPVLKMSLPRLKLTLRNLRFLGRFVKLRRELRRHEMAHVKIYREGTNSCTSTAMQAAGCKDVWVTFENCMVGVMAEQSVFEKAARSRESTGR